jgi:hypothetical protein
VAREISSSEYNEGSAIDTMSGQIHLRSFDTATVWRSKAGDLVFGQVFPVCPKRMGEMIRKKNLF